MNDRKFLIESSRLAQGLIADLHDRDPGNETFGQVGLLNGHDIVIEFVEHGELGCALYHLLYMIHESDITYPMERVLRLHELAKRIGEKNCYSKENQENLSDEQLAAIFNKPETL